MNTEIDKLVMGIILVDDGRRLGGGVGDQYVLELFVVVQIN